MSRHIAEKVIDRAYDSNEKSLSFYKRMIIVHVVLSVMFLVVSIGVNAAYFWVEAYTLPALVGFTVAHRVTTRNNSDIIHRSTEAIGKINDQKIIKQNLRLQKFVEKLLKGR